MGGPVKKAVDIGKKVVDPVVSATEKVVVDPVVSATKKVVVDPVKSLVPDIPEMPALPEIPETPKPADAAGAVASMAKTEVSKKGRASTILAGATTPGAAPMAQPTIRRKRLLGSYSERTGG